MAKYKQHVFIQEELERKEKISKMLLGTFEKETEMQKLDAEMQKVNNKSLEKELHDFIESIKI